MPPKLFMSYSQTNPDYSERVRRLADTLISDGIEIILDQYDLREGQEANAFMEQMVTSDDIQKVGLFCDPIYVTKANGRLGGVGTESQIVSSELYRQQGESKFVAIIMERPDDPDVKPVPAFYTSRIYIDLSDDAQFEEQYEQLVRWVFDKPRLVKPAIGKAPTFLNADTVTTSTTLSRQRRALDALRQGKSNAPALVEEYLDSVIDVMEGFRFEPTEVIDGAKVRESINAFAPVRDEIMTVVDASARHLEQPQAGRVFHIFLERLLPLRYKAEGVNNWRRNNFDNLRFLISEIYLCILAAFLKAHRFEASAMLLGPYYNRGGDRGEAMAPPTVLHFGDQPYLAEGHEQQTSPVADLMKARLTPDRFNDVMQADLVLRLRSEREGFWWFPHTLIYSDRWSPYELFARAESRAMLELFLPVVGVDNADQLRELIEKDDIGRSAAFFSAGGIALGRLTNYEKLGSRP